MPLKRSLHASIQSASLHEMRHLVCLLYWYDITNTTCFTGTKVQILTAVSGHIAETIQGVAVVKASYTPLTHL
jgi:hypothetical protein